MPQDNRIRMVCVDCNHIGYDTTKNKKNIKDRLQRKKYCRFEKKHTLHKETK